VLASKESVMTRFTIPDMDCEGCVSAITRAVQTKDPQAHVSANLSQHLVEITSTLDPSILAAAIDGAGFTVEAH
jgi:copper chaperone CopZ